MLQKIRIYIVFLFILTFCTATLSFAQDSVLLDYIKDKSEIREGGCDIFEYMNSTCLICVSSVNVGNKSEFECKKVGSSKAKRDIISYINGSDISSCTQLIISETSQSDVSGVKNKIAQEFTEKIKETVIGNINRCTPLGGWYSEDRSVYYFSLYRVID